ncbi:MAG: endonuclease III domain-containing protein [Rhodopila sp.]
MPAPRSRLMPSAARTTLSSRKEPFDVDEVFCRLRIAVADVPKAAMFELRDRGHGSLFEQLVASLISSRTRDETTIPVCLRLFATARTPEAMASLDEPTLVRLLHGATFPEPKARDILALSHRIAGELNGMVPTTQESLMSFRGIGPKIAALALGVALGQPHIAVDVHVHRISNRWGIVATSTPERTQAALRSVLPERYWVEINERLVPFGKHICTAQRPRCSNCLLLGLCRQVGVSTHR